MFNCIKKFIRRKRQETQRFISLYLIDTPTEYDFFFTEKKEVKSKEAGKNLVKNDNN